MLYERAGEFPWLAIPAKAWCSTCGLQEPGILMWFWLLAGWRSAWPWSSWHDEQAPKSFKNKMFPITSTYLPKLGSKSQVSFDITFANSWINLKDCFPLSFPWVCLSLMLWPVHIKLSPTATGKLGLSSSFHRLLPHVLYLGQSLAIQNWFC